MTNVKFLGYLIAGMAVLLFLGWLTFTVAKAFLFIGALFFIWGAIKIKNTFFKKDHDHGNESN